MAVLAVQDFVAEVTADGTVQLQQLSMGILRKDKEGSECLEGQVALVADLPQPITQPVPVGGAFQVSATTDGLLGVGQDVQILIRVVVV